MSESAAAYRAARKLPVAKGTRRAGTMNKTEARYAETLEQRQRAGEIVWYRYEAITLKLADDTRYTPDFAVLLANGEIELHEVKGFFRDDARIKIKVAAEHFPFRFVLIREIPKKSGGGWTVQVI